MITTNTPLAMFLRKGTLADPYVYVTETNRMITDGGTIVLQEFPINQTGYVQYSGGGSPISDAVAVSVVLTIDSVDVTFAEVRDPSVTLGAEQFRVDYEFGLLEFDPTLYGTEVVKTITYAGRGAYYIAASRVYDDSTYTSDLSNDEFGTLQDVLDSVSSINVNSTSTGAPGTNATVTVTGTSFDFIIPRGDPFEIAVEYPTIADMDANTNPTPSGYTPASFDLAIITSNVEDADNAKLYIYNGSSWDFISDMSGATGPMRPIRWKPDGLGGTLSTLQWQKNDGTWDVDNEKDLSLTTQFGVAPYTDTTLTIANSDGVVVNQELGVYAEWVDTTLTVTNPDTTIVSHDLGITASWSGSALTIESNDYVSGVSGFSETEDLGWDYQFGSTGQQITELSIKPKTESTFITQQLGVYASISGTSITLTNPNGTTVGPQKLSLDFNWTTDVNDNVILQVKDPADVNYNVANDQQLSPDIAFSSGGSGEVLLSVVPPGATADPQQLSPDITFNTDVEGYVGLSVVQPGETASYNRISPQISWDATEPKIAIVPPNETIVSGDYIQVGIIHQGLWSAATTYNRLDMVSYGGSSYVSLVNSNLNNTPGSSPSEWALSAQKATLHMAATPPSGPNNGDMWWNTENAALFVYYTDADSNQWVEVRSSGAPAQEADQVAFTPGASGYTATDVQAALLEAITLIADNVIHIGTTAPASPSEGRLWFNTTSGDKNLYFYNGTTWIGTNTYQ